MKKTDKKRRNQYRKYLQLSGVGIQMGITIYLGAYFGKKLDAHFPNDKNIYTFLLILIAFIISMVSLIMQLKRINDKYE